MQAQLPREHRALVLEAIETGFNVQNRATPQPTHGSAVVQVSTVGLLSYHREIYNGTRSYQFPIPLVGGFSGVGRVAAVGPDATTLHTGQLVFIGSVIRARDDQDVVFLIGVHEGFTSDSKRLMEEIWRDGTLAEFVNVPLENCMPLDEATLCRSLGYTVHDLAYLCYLLVPYGGLRDINVEPGDTIVVCPATGGFGGAGVMVAVAMGARVIAMGRNEKELARLKTHVKQASPRASIETVSITGDEAQETAALKEFGTIDAVLDFSPPAAVDSTHLKSALGALRRGGRCSIMGFVGPSVVDWTITRNNITLKGKFMYEREDMLQLGKMLERGLFPTGKQFVDVRDFDMEHWKEAFDVATEHAGIGKLVTISP